MRQIGLLGLMLACLTLVVTQLPDVIRYMKMRAM